MGEAPTWRVFLSHTADLRRFPQERSYVDAAQEAVIRAGHAVTDMAYFAARDQQPAKVCRDAVAAADVYVVVAAFRYGSLVTDDPQSSYTELEFDTATDIGIPRLVFLLAPDAAGPEDLFSDPVFGARQERFRTRLRKAGLVAVIVNSPAQLEVTLLQALVCDRGNFAGPTPRHRRHLHGCRGPGLPLEQSPPASWPRRSSRRSRAAWCPPWCSVPRSQRRSSPSSWDGPATAPGPSSRRGRSNWTGCGIRCLSTTPDPPASPRRNRP